MPPPLFTEKAHISNEDTAGLNLSQDRCMQALRASRALRALIDPCFHFTVRGNPLDGLLYGTFNEAAIGTVRKIRLP